MAFLAPAVGPLLNLISSQLLAEYARINGISDKLKAWGRKLRMIQAVMDSAEERQMNGDPAADQWLSDLREVAYDMEDLLENFTVDAERNSAKVRALSQRATLPNCLIACCSRIDPRTVISDHHMANEIEDVDQRLEEIYRHIQFLGLAQNPRSGSPSVTDFGQPRFATTALPEPKFVGREKQMEELLSRLTGSGTTDDSAGPYTVVSIVGMGGLGKTTLAQQIYGHVSLNTAGFEAKAWSCVSDVFDRSAVTKSILDQVGPPSSSAEKDLNLLQISLKQKLSGKKFLIVLDDVWNTKYDEVESLLKPFYFGRKGSMILLTTRDIKVAEVVGDPDPLRLDLLPLVDCVSLLAYHSIGKQNFESQPHLQNIAVEVAKKCKGLPLSIKTIGGLLRFKRDDEQWEKVLAHGIWDTEDVQGKIPPALKLSYVHLPVQLKRCFAACALFPKDYLFDQDEVIQLWIARGQLEKGTSRTYREVGLKCLHRLEAVSLLQKWREDRKTYYLMHDLINDLSKSVVVDAYFSSDEYEEGSSPVDSLCKVRHVAMVAQNFERFVSRKFDLYRSMKKLRTFMAFQISTRSHPNIYVSQKVLHELIMTMKNLRQLSLRYFHLREVPDEIGELKLLRQVDFSYTNIEELPESICDLVQLRSLLLRGCKKLMKLPRDMHKLTNLLHLDIIDTDSLKEMPPLVRVLINLEILSKFVVGKEAGHELKQLGRLKCIQRELHVCNLLDVEDIEDAKSANLSEKEEVHELSFDWRSSCTASLVEDNHQLNLLDHLRPSRKIESLALYGYGGKKFPSWLENPCMNNVVRITLEGCKSVDSLPPFGLLPSLEQLDIRGLEAVSGVGAEFYGIERPFRSLRILRFENMGCWEKWSSYGDYRPFPCLRQLLVIDCPKLEGGGILSLPTVEEICIDGCDEGLLKCLVDLTSMTKMNILNIPQLVHFDERFSTYWVALRQMRIQGCPRFKSFTDGVGRKQDPPMLKHLEIRGCGDLEKLPDDLSGLTSLDVMIVDDCGRLSSISSGVLPPALKKLVLHGCPSLPPSDLISSRTLESLVELSLVKLEGHVSITELAEGGRLSRSLRKLLISDCGSVAILPDSLRHLSSLSQLSLDNCPTIEMDELTALPRNLSCFELKECPKVKCLPQDMHDLTSLKDLVILSCEGMTWLKRGGLPPNLEALGIDACRKMKQPVEEWGLHGLTTLRLLCIWGEMECVDGMETFPLDVEWGRLLPSSIKNLYIGGMKKLERLGRGLASQLPSLVELLIGNCERLKWLPEDGLPDSLERLDIQGCPVLVERCSSSSNPKGDYWPLIQLIPQLRISSEKFLKKI